MFDTPLKNKLMLQPMKVLYHCDGYISNIMINNPIASQNYGIHLLLTQILIDQFGTMCNLILLHS